MRTSAKLGLLCAAMMASAALLIMTGPTLAAPPVYHARVRFGGSNKATVYLKFQNNTLWVANSAQGLAAAQPIKATKTQTHNDARDMASQYSAFPETTLPVSIEGLSAVKATFSTYITRYVGRSKTVQRRTDSFVSAQLQVSKKDSSGTVWTYIFSQGTPVTEGQKPADALVMTVPAIGELKLAMETKVEKRNARIGLRLTSNGMQIEDLRKNGKSATAQIEATDRKGAVAISEKGDLKKFGFT